MGCIIKCPTFVCSGNNWNSGLFEMSIQYISQIPGLIGLEADSHYTIRD